MNPMIETAARAICRRAWAAVYAGERLEEIIYNRWRDFVPEALAALRAMREVEPTGAMREAIYAWIRTAMDTDELWRALLGAIVDQGGE